MFIFETSSHIWAFLRVLLHSVLFFYRADMSWESFWQFRLVCSAWCTHFCLGSLLTFLLALYICFHGWTGGKTGSSRWSGQVVVFALQIGDGATTLPHHSHTQTRDIFFAHSTHPSAPAHTTGHRNAPSDTAWCIRCSAERARKGHPSLWTCRFGWVCLPCLRAAGGVCTYVHL